MSFQTKELLLPDGGSPFAEWFGSLEAVAAAKVRVAVALWEDYKRREASTSKRGR
ncbi:MAG: hypothetical protein ACK5X5_00445 [bacterium]